MPERREIFVSLLNRAIGSDELYERIVDDALAHGLGLVDLFILAFRRGHFNLASSLGSRIQGAGIATAGQYESAVLEELERMANQEDERHLFTFANQRQITNFFQGESLSRFVNMFVNNVVMPAVGIQSVNVAHFSRLERISLQLVRIAELHLSEEQLEEIIRTAVGQATIGLYAERRLDELRRGGRGG